MEENYTWCNYCSYYLIDKNGNKLLNHKKINCFSRLPMKFKEIDTITIHDYYIKPTVKYADKYIEYIVDMLKLEDVVIKENSFTFKAFPERKKNLLILTLVRFLFEYIGYNRVTNKINDKFFNDLFNGKSKYRNKLKRFCHFYQKLANDFNTKKYFGENHAPNPIKVKIKSYIDFKKTNFKFIGVNQFFYEE